MLDHSLRGPTGASDCPDHRQAQCNSAVGADCCQRRENEVVGLILKKQIPHD